MQIIKDLLFVAKIVIKIIFTCLVIDGFDYFLSGIWDWLSCLVIFPFLLVWIIRDFERPEKL